MKFTRWAARLLAVAFMLAVGCAYDGSSAIAPSPDPLLLSGDLLIPVQRDVSAR